MRQLFLLSLIVTLLVSCNKKGTNENLFVNEVKSLNSCNKREIFLRDILERDQQVRSRVGEMKAKYGHNSEEKQLALELMNLIDEENRQKIALFLDEYGYPTSSCHTENTTDVPILVIHHSGSTDLMRSYFTVFYEAYLKGDIRESMMSLYLERIHIIENGFHFTMPSPYKSQDKIDTLISILEVRKS
ncbi:hypothetical protein E1176_03105 [Fulvivirga sp. RKSG066]|uniref:hypothetical protein n=1 Tax=Fulvivirga aurantia TaxID=2529383 RepID=UPI0012BBCAEA|nr:hypothetical protein [Fulvivirga aurantia]MTI20001.1 hypothetical protein [Fulvivirga aurantia]